MKYVNKPVPKTDAMSLVTGKPVYTDDLAPSDCLIVKLLRSPHANAWVEEIKTDAAKKIEGIACVLTYEDVSHKRFTLAGQTAPEISPWDRYIIDKHVRFVGDPVAIVAGETEEAVDKALKRIKVKYRKFSSIPLPCPKRQGDAGGHRRAIAGLHGAVVPECAAIRCGPGEPPIDAPAARASQGGRPVPAAEPGERRDRAASTCLPCAQPARNDGAELLIYPLTSA